MSRQYYYFGELGFFNIEILGALAHYFKLHPDEVLEVTTFKDYACILELLFIGNIKTHIYDKEFINSPNNRSGHRSYLDQSFDRLRVKNLMIISKHNDLNKYSIDEFSAGPRCSNLVKPRLFYLDKPIQYHDTNLVDKNIVCICPRYRSHFSGKNILSDEWDIVYNKIKEHNKDAKIVALGKKQEMLSLTYPDIIYPKDIYEHIYYMNNCDYGVFPDSGMAEFALNCACKTVKVIYKKQFYSTFNRKGEPKPLLHGFNPFNCNVQKIESLGELL